MCGSAEGRCVTRSVVCGLVSAPENFREYLGFESSFMMRDYVCGVRSGAVVCPAPIRSHASKQSDPRGEPALILVKVSLLCIVTGALSKDHPNPNPDHFHFCIFKVSLGSLL